MEQSILRSAAAGYSGVARGASANRNMLVVERRLLAAGENAASDDLSIQTERGNLLRKIGELMPGEW